MRLLALVAVLVVTASTARAEELDPRVLVMPVEGSAPSGMRELPDEIGDALARGAGTTSSTVTRATASLDDTAVIVGCEPAEAACLDAVAAALNVDQLLIARMAPSGSKDVTVEIVAVTRETEPVRQTFTIHAVSKEADLQSMEAALPVLLEAGEARRKEKAKIETGPDPDPDPEPEPEPGPERTRNLKPLLVAGGGVAVAFAGMIFWTLASGTQQQIDDAPTGSAADLERLASLEATAKDRALAGNILVITGAVAIAGGVTWYFLDRREEVRAAPLVVPGGGGIAVGGAW